MTVPIFATAYLLPKQRIERVGLLREMPLRLNVVTEAHEKDPLAFLRYAEVCDVEHAQDHSIREPTLRALAGVVLLKPT